MVTMARVVRKALPVPGVSGKIHRHGRFPPFGRTDQFGQPGDIVRPEYYIDMRSLFLEGFPFLLGQTAPHGDQASGTAPLPTAKPAECAVDLPVRLLPDAAAVQQHEVGFGKDPGGLVFLRNHEGNDAGRIDLVHLAAEGFDVDFPGHGIPL